MTHSSNIVVPEVAPGLVTCEKFLLYVWNFSETQISAFEMQLSISDFVGRKVKKMKVVLFYIIKLQNTNLMCIINYTTYIKLHMYS